MEDLFEKLRENRDSGVYPYHMPGHKRQVCGGLSRELCELDITEIDGFDNLHQPEGILLRLQQRAARLYGAEESFYLVNGSTAGILSAISAALPRGGHILMARNCHKSAYHGVYLRNLKASYLYPSKHSSFDLFDEVEPEQVRRALEAEPEIGAVLLVSPSYEGRILDIRAIADIVHEKGIPLIVDEAHGAHLGFGAVSPENSCRAGADLVVHSVHKTLPALTQTALLHINGNLIDRQQLRRFLRIYQTSSPSYPLMASIDNALQFVEREGEKAFGQFARLYGEMLEKLSACICLKILPWDRKRQDIGKLVVSVKDTDISGQKLYDILLHEYKLQLEMAAANYVLAMFTVNDSPEGYERMTRALLEIDGRLAAAESRTIASDRITAAALSSAAKAQTVPCATSSAAKQLEFQFQTQTIKSAGIMEPPVCMVPLSEAWDMDVKEIPLEESAGSCVGEFVNLYPPGVPVLVPGEQITRQLCERVKSWLSAGLTVQGVRRHDDKICIKILADR